MKQLEDSTLDLIHRRRVRTSHSAGMVIFLVMAAAAALPLIRVDIITSARGMVRPFEASMPLGCRVSGTVERTILADNLQVNQGDTLLWICRDQLDAQIATHCRLVETNLKLIEDIRLILADRSPVRTSRFRQSYRNHRSALAQLQLQEKYLLEEFRIAEQLYREEVIAEQDYRKAQSEYVIVHARVEQMRESYLNMLEEELYRLSQEVSHSEDEVRMLYLQADDYAVVAPAGGVILDCPGIKPGSVIHAGTTLGMVSPVQRLVAECYMEPEDLTLLREKSLVKLRFDDPGFRSVLPVESRVEFIDRDVTMVQGTPLYRVRCPIEDCLLRFSDGTESAIRNGMTFTATIVLFRQTLLAILLQKMEEWAAPTRNTSERSP